MKPSSTLRHLVTQASRVQGQAPVDGECCTDLLRRVSLNLLRELNARRRRGAETLALINIHIKYIVA